MKRIMVEESLYEFAKRGRPKKRGRKPKVGPRGIDAPDTWNSDLEDEEGPIEDIDVDVTDMTDTDAIEIEEDVFDDKLFKALSNEVKLLEPNRRVVKFRLKGDLSKVLFGIPMLKIGDNAFVFKLRDGSLKKVFLRDMILEQEKRSNRARTINEIFYEIPRNNKGAITDVKDNWKHDELTGEEYCECDDPDIDASGKCRNCGGWYTPDEEDQDYRKESNY